MTQETDYEIACTDVANENIWISKSRFWNCQICSCSISTIVLLIIWLYMYSVGGMSLRINDSLLLYAIVHLSVIIAENCNKWVGDNQLFCWGITLFEILEINWLNFISINWLNGAEEKPGCRTSRNCMIVCQHT